MAETLRRDRRPTESLEAVARRRLQTWIDATGITQTTLAIRIGKNQAWMSRYLAGDAGADIDTLAALAHVFGHSVSALIDTAVDPQDQLILDLYHALPEDGRPVAEAVLRLMTQKPRARRRP